MIEWKMCLLKYGRLVARRRPCVNWHSWSTTHRLTTKSSLGPFPKSTLTSFQPNPTQSHSGATHPDTHGMIIEKSTTKSAIERDSEKGRARAVDTDIAPAGLDVRCEVAKAGVG